MMINRASGLQSNKLVKVDRISDKSDGQAPLEDDKVAEESGDSLDLDTSKE